MKPRKCKSCQKEYTPTKQAQPKCLPCIQQAEKDKKFQSLKKQLKKPLKQVKKPKPKIDPKWKKIADFVKLRDAGKPCISCGKFAGKYEAGHFISRATCKALYYEPRNIHAQCWQCNNNHQKQQETYINFRNGLISRYGIEYVEWLESVKKKEWEIIKSQGLLLTSSHFFKNS